jgi:hypothetical protein
MNTETVPASPAVPPFIGFPKMSRLSRDIIITEKIDGTNAQVYITDTGEFYTGSRTRWIVPGDDNFGFAAWAHAHKDELMTLGPGQHFGEWWGAGIQRKYGLKEKRFSLFSVSRWVKPRTDGPTPALEGQEPCPACCDVVPTLYRGLFSMLSINWTLKQLEVGGSVAAPGFLDPEGLVVFHTAARTCFKKTIKGDEKPKSQT